MGIFNLEQQLAFYGAYHANAGNKFIHILCVPAILWTALVFAANTGILPQLAPLSTFLKEHLPFLGLEANLGLPVALMYGLYYTILEPYAGLAGFVLVLVAEKTATDFLHSRPDANWIALYTHTFSWIAQFFGHGVLEGRAPALLDNLLQAFVLAPFFVFLEVLFMFGYRPALHKRVRNAVGVKIAEYRRGLKDKKKK